MGSSLTSRDSWGEACVLKWLILHFSPIQNPPVQSMLHSWTIQWQHLQKDHDEDLWSWSVGWARLFSPSFTSADLRFFLACHCGSQLELCLWFSISKLCCLQWRLNCWASFFFSLFLYKCWTTFTFRPCDSCLDQFPIGHLKHPFSMFGFTCVCRSRVD